MSHRLCDKVHFTLIINFSEFYFFVINKLTLSLVYLHSLYLKDCKSRTALINSTSGGLSPSVGYSMKKREDKTLITVAKTVKPKKSQKYGLQRGLRRDYPHVI